jgi:hypothetical protein
MAVAESRVLVIRDGRGLSYFVVTDKGSLLAKA